MTPKTPAPIDDVLPTRLPEPPPPPPPPAKEEPVPEDEPETPPAS